MFFVLFKQKTAYEMRISDWSSDVCSSDLLDIDDVETPDERGRVGERQRAFVGDEGQGPLQPIEIGLGPAPQRLFELRDPLFDEQRQQRLERPAVIALVGIDPDPGPRPRGADRGDAQYILVEIAGQLDLERRLRIDGERRLRHRLWRVGTERQRRAQRARLVETGKIPQER